MKSSAPIVLALSVFLCGFTLVGSAGVPDSLAAGARGTPATVDALGAQLVLAIHKNDEALALKLLPSQEELRRAGLADHAAEKRYAELLARAKRDFAKVLAKHRRKHPEGCKRLAFSKVKLGTVQRRGSLSIYDSIDVFAKCDGREIWIADPDGVFQTTGGWRLLEIS